MSSKPKDTKSAGIPGFFAPGVIVVSGLSMTGWSGSSGNPDLHSDAL